eukprot:TRINITY_DN3309_c0_g1_i1.p1 TRINITY_DN3309_c0_g1~~TRINITY_DN3309_c0_g1_i1.p1  ORF type:complete len:260 (-),score=52.58 TRINITY_DN3309_c0_g1_i1:60-839(-)
MSMDLKYRTVKTIGQGAFAKVDLVEDHRGRKLAKKYILPKGRKLLPQSWENETYCGTKLKHKNIIEVKESWQEADNQVLLMEYVEGCDLYYLLEAQQFTPLDEKQCRRLFKEMCKGLKYCHSKGIAHRDLKLDNIMIDKKGHVKIIDFGLCECCHPDHCREAVGSSAYAAPEVGLGMGRPTDYDGFQCDVWSLGIVLYTILFGIFPYTGRGYTASMPLVFSRKHEVSDSAKNLLSHMLQPDPKRRFTLKEVGRHPWYSK